MTAERVSSLFPRAPAVEPERHIFTVECSNGNWLTVRRDADGGFTVIARNPSSGAMVEAPLIADEAVRLRNALGSDLKRGSWPGIF